MANKPSIFCLVFLALVATSSSTPVFEPIQALVRAPESPVGRLIQGPDGNFYGLSTGGGAKNNGAYFRVTPTGVITILASFGTALVTGRTPVGDLVVGTDGAFYGVTSSGGAFGYGSIFRATEDGTVATIASFDWNTGQDPHSGLILGSDGYLYGTTRVGGTAAAGTVYRVIPGTTTAITTLASFPASAGRQPVNGLVEGSPGTFYGTTSTSGTGNGTIFRFSSGNVLTDLASFTTATGVSPSGTLLRDVDGNLFGVCGGGGPSSVGTIFKYSSATGTLSAIASFSQSLSSSLFSPRGGLTSGPDGAYYGVASSGGFPAQGGIFRVAPTGACSTFAVFPSDDIWNAAYGLTLATDGNFYFTTPSGGANSVGTFWSLDSSASLTRLADFVSTSGLNPSGAVCAADGCIYGTASSGGASNMGALFKIAPNSTTTTLVNFKQSSDGRNPYTPPYLAPDGNIYGTTSNISVATTAHSGLVTGYGTVFRLNPSGIFSTIATFSIGRGGSPAGLIQLPDGTIFGTTPNGDGNNLQYGSVFRIDPQSTFSTVTSFTPAGPNTPGPLSRGLDGNLYGTTSSTPTVFRLSTSGQITTLAALGGTLGTSPSGPVAEDESGNLYGACWGGGPVGLGTLFRVSPSGDATALVSFNDANGGHPSGGLVRGPDGNFYGTASQFNGSPTGSLFQLRADGTFTTLYTFSGSAGSVPTATLTTGADGHLYGTTTTGGTTASGQPAGGGQIYRLRFGPAISNSHVTPSATAAVLTADVNPAGAPTIASFQYSTDPGLATFTTIAGQCLPSGPLPVDSISHVVTATLNGLSPGTLYYFRAIATNSENSNPQIGAVLSFSTPALDYQSWAENLGVLAGPNADEYHRGLPNLLYYAFGLSPQLTPSQVKADSGQFIARGTPLLQFVSGQGQFLFSRRKNHAALGLHYTPEFGNDLSTWTPSADPVTIVASDNEVELVSVPFPLTGGNPVRFARVRVTLP